MQIKDLTTELDAKAMTAVEGGGRARDRIAQVKQENVAEQALENHLNVANYSDFSGDNVFISVNNDVDQSLDQDARSKVKNG